MNNRVESDLIALILK